MYALVQYVARCTRETLAATKVDDTGPGRRLTSPLRLDVYAIPLARGTSEHDERRFQRQPATGTNNRRATNETAPGEHRRSNLEPDRQQPLTAPNDAGTVRDIFCRRKTNAS